MMRTIDQKLDSILPDPAARGPLLAIFAESMRYIRSRKPEWCVVRFNGKHLRLFAGRLIVLTLESDEIWVTTDPEVRSVDWSLLRSWRWDEASYPRYRRTPSRNGYYAPRMDERGEWGEIRRAHHQYLDRVLKPGVAPDHRSIARHDSAILDYIDAIIPDLANPLPDGYETGSDRLPFDPQAIADART